MHLPSHDGLTFVNSMGKEVWEMVCDESFKHRKSISALMSMSEDLQFGGFFELLTHYTDHCLVPV